MIGNRNQRFCKHRCVFERNDYEKENTTNFVSDNIGCFIRTGIFIQEICTQYKGVFCIEGRSFVLRRKVIVEIENDGPETVCGGIP